MFDQYYIIKKTKSGGLSAVPMFGGISGLFLPIWFIIMPIVAIVFVYMDNDIDKDGFFILLMVGMIPLLFYGIYLLNEGIKQRKLRNFKSNGGGVVKKAKVTSIGTIKTKENGCKVDVYYLEAEDSGMTYYSYGYTDGNVVSDGSSPTYWQVYDNKVSVGDKVDVYFNPDNPDRYWVDIDFLF